MFCPSCGVKNEEGGKFCFKCGTKLVNNVEKVIVNNSINVSTSIPETPTKQICLVCKGKGKKVNKLHLVLGLILGLLVFPIIAVATGGVTLIASAIIIFWGLSKNECKVCRGTGYLTML